tara:strand:+ start:20 stop:487 length:468 start_codon:yes stop_codon:yes gene_type:complete
MKNQINTTVNSEEERQELLKQLNAMTFKEEAVINWKDLKDISGYYVNSIGTVQLSAKCTPVERNKTTFATKQQAESSKAYAQLTQLMKQVNDDWTPDWNDSFNVKVFTIRCNKGVVYRDWGYTLFSFIAFPTAAIRDEFLINHRELLETYYMINK